MEAKVKDNARFFRYVFFSGHEYIKGEWRAVPTDSEEQARKEPALDIRDGKKQPVEKVELPAAEPIVVPVEEVEQLQEEQLEEKHTRRGRKSTRKEIESLDAEE